VKSFYRNLSVACCIFVLMLIAEISFAQEKNPTVYPYGGVPNSSRMRDWYEFVPLNFAKALFDSVLFDNLANFVRAKFDSSADFHHAHFDSVANFREARFDRAANFGSTQFDNIADFAHTVFKSVADFESALFHSTVYFSNAIFDSVNFANANFHGKIHFEDSYFDKIAIFANARFDTLHLARATIEGEFWIGSDEEQTFDFDRTIFSSSSRLVVYDLVNLKIQPEKFKHISFGDNLDYFTKKDIIENLKTKSFDNDKGAQFELDYIFAKSTLYQEQVGYAYWDASVENKWYEILKWPKWFINTIYYWTMGLGYRPFRLIWWMLVTIIIYTAIFAKKIPDRINAYISNPNPQATGEEKKEIHLSLWETLLNCAYFSVMVFFTFRLKREILTFFDAKEKRLIVAEWVIGFLVYVAFLTLSKSGSILHNLKELFVGKKFRSRTSTENHQYICNTAS